MSPTLQRLFTVSGLLAFLLSCWLCCVAVFIVVISSEKDLNPAIKTLVRDEAALKERVLNPYAILDESERATAAQVYLKVTGEASVGEFQRDPKKIQELEKVWYAQNTFSKMQQMLFDYGPVVWTPLGCLLFLCAVNWVATGSTRLRFWQPHPSAPSKP